VAIILAEPQLGPYVTGYQRFLCLFEVHMKILHWGRQVFKMLDFRILWRGCKTSRYPYILPLDAFCHLCMFSARTFPWTWDTGGSYSHIWRLFTPNISGGQWLHFFILWVIICSL